MLSTNDILLHYLFQFENHLPQSYYLSFSSDSTKHTIPHLIVQ